MDDFDDEFELLDPVYDEYPYETDVWYQDIEEPTQTLTELYKLCIIPVVRDGISHVGKLILWCLIYRISTQIVSLPLWACHLISACTGVYMLHQFFSYSVIYILAYVFTLYSTYWLTTQFVGRYRGLAIAVIAFLYIVCYEYFLIEKREWHKIRGPQMIISMKTLSLAFETDIGTFQNIPSPVAFMGYVLNVGTCVLGPWVSYKDYLALYSKPLWNATWVRSILTSAGSALIFLSISTCWSHWLITDNSWRWLLVYQEALSFRTSHYFVSFASEATAVVAGFGRTADDTWNLPVSRPHYIEFPRSMVQVVVYWNMPMHYWLKTYVFRTTKPFGSFVAVLTTYAVSALLHGINFQLAAVLLSLGFYSYVEYVLRQKLASIFKACIQVRACRKECCHQVRKSDWSTRLVNLGFGAIVVFHLAYLGVMFDSSDQQEHGYSASHTLLKWAKLDFASHWVVLATYLFYLVI